MLWTVFVIIVLAGLALLLLVDLLRERSTAARIAGLLALVVGGLYGAEILDAWQVLIALVVVVGLYVTGRRREGVA